MPTQRSMTRALLVIALAGLAFGLLSALAGKAVLAGWLWAAGTLPVVIALLASIVRKFLSGRLGVDVVAFVAMSAGLLLGEQLAAVVVAVMYAGGNVLEDLALARAEHDLNCLVVRAPRTANRLSGGRVEEIPVDQVLVGDTLLVRGGEIVPVDGVVLGHTATLDESALTGEPIPVERVAGDVVRSGTLNAGEAFRLTATASATESTYAGVVRMVMEARGTRAPFIRLAD